MKVYVVTEYHLNEGGSIAGIYAREMDARHRVETERESAKGASKVYIEFEYEEYEVVEAAS